MAKSPTRIYAGLQMHYWTIIQRLKRDRSCKSPNLQRRVKVRCVCGTIESLPLYYLTRKNPKMHCGCKNRGLPASNKLEYRSWYMMNVRCQNPKHVAFAEYGGRGIFVCPEWHKSNPHGFANFLKDMGPRTSLRLTLDRIDPNGPYAPMWNGKKQCRWATWEQQNNNKRRNIIVEEQTYTDVPPMPPPPELDVAAFDLGLEEELMLADVVVGIDDAQLMICEAVDSGADADADADNGLEEDEEDPS